MVDKRFYREGGGSFDGRLYFMYLKFTFIALHLQKKKLEGGVRTQKKKRWRGGGAQIFCNPSAPYDIKWNSPNSLLPHTVYGILLVRPELIIVPSLHCILDPGKSVGISFCVTAINRILILD